MDPLTNSRLGGVILEVGTYHHNIGYVSLSEGPEPIDVSAPTVRAFIDALASLLVADLLAEATGARA